MRSVFGLDEYVCAWVEERVDADIIKGRGIGFFDGDRLIAGVAYSNYRGCDIEILAAAEHKRWLSKGVLYTIFAYPFIQLGCLRVTAITAKKNKHARQFIEKIGFRLEGMHPKAMDGRDACSYGMLRQHCKWIQGNGKEIRTIRTASA